MAPNPKFKNTFATHLEWDTETQYAGDSRKEVDGSKSISVKNVYLCNDGDEGKCALQIWDWKKSKEIQWKQKTLSKDECISDGDLSPFKLVDHGYSNGDDVDIALIAYYWDGATWKQNDSLGCNFGEDKPVKPPKPPRVTMEIRCIPCYQRRRGEKCHFI